MGRATGSMRTVRELATAYGERPFRFAEAVADRVATERGLRTAVGAGQVVRVRPRVGVIREALEAVAEDPIPSHELQVRAVLPVPELAVRAVAAGRTYFLDMLWRAQQVVGECDGWGKYSLGGRPMEALRAEKRREDDLRSVFRQVVRWTSDEMLHHPEVPIARVRRALVRS